MTESLDEGMTGMGDHADHGDTPAGRLEAFAYDEPDHEVTADLRAVLDENKTMRDMLGLVGQWGIRFRATDRNLDYPMPYEQAAREALAETDGNPRWCLIHRQVGEWKEVDPGRVPDPLEASDSWSRAQADDEQAAQQVEADLRAARDMFRTPEPDADLLYLIWSHERGAWWKPRERGYTSNLREAGRYSRARAQEISRDANAYGWVNGLPKEVVVPWTDDPQAAAAAMRKATAALIAEREAKETRDA